MHTINVVVDWLAASKDKESRLAESGPRRCLREAGYSPVRW